MILDTYGGPDSNYEEMREKLDEILERPFDGDQERQREFDREHWARKNVEVARKQGMGEASDPFLAKPVVR